MILRSMTRAFVLIAAGKIGLLCVPAPVFAQERECSVPEHFYISEPQLTKIPKAIVHGQEVVIVALGGASTLSIAAGKPDLAWPARFAAALAEKFPSARIKVVNLAVARQTAKRSAERLDREVIPMKPNLVIWETGTMEAVRGMDTDEFRETLRSGMDELKTAGIETVLMNMQFSRDSEAVIHFEPYLAAMSQLADASDVPLFRRHGIMRHWAESGSLDLRVTDSDQRRLVAAKLYDCIGRAMADFVMRGISAATSPVKVGNDR
jgi:GDSL-like lipase/acylhydrolase family protein